MSSLHWFCICRHVQILTGSAAVWILGSGLQGDFPMDCQSDHYIKNKIMKKIHIQGQCCASFVLWTMFSVIHHSDVMSAVVGQFTFKNKYLTLRLSFFPAWRHIPYANQMPRIWIQTVSNSCLYKKNTFHGCLHDKSNACIYQRLALLGIWAQITIIASISEREIRTQKLSFVSPSLRVQDV